MKKGIIAILIITAAFLTGIVHAQIPQILNYQGRVSVNGTNFDGTGQFQFAFVNEPPGTTTYWSNGNNVVSLPVTAGLYSVLLGDTNVSNMAAIPVTVFTNTDVRLRVWFDGGAGLEQLAPDQRLAAVGYALMAGNMPDGSITSNKLAAGAVTAMAIANGAVGTSQLGSNVVTSANIASNTITEANLAPEVRPPDITAFVGTNDERLIGLPNAIVGTAGTASTAGNALQVGGVDLSGLVQTNGIITNAAAGYRVKLNQGLPASSSYSPVQFFYSTGSGNQDDVLHWRFLPGEITNEWHGGWDTVDINNPSYVFSAYRYWNGSGWSVQDAIAQFVTPGQYAGAITYGNRKQPTGYHTFVGGTNAIFGQTVSIESRDELPALRVWNTTPGSNFVQIIEGHGLVAYRLTLDPTHTQSTDWLMDYANALNGNTQSLIRITGRWNASASRAITFPNTNGAPGLVWNPDALGNGQGQLAINNTGSLGNTAVMVISAPVSPEMLVIATNTGASANISVRAGHYWQLVAIPSGAGQTGVTNAFELKNNTTYQIPLTVLSNGQIVIGTNGINAASFPVDNNQFTVRGSMFASNGNFAVRTTLNGWTNLVDNGDLVWTNGAGGWMRLTPQGTMTTGGT